MRKMIIACVLALLLVAAVMLCGCDKSDKPTNNITIVPEETVLKVTKDMTRADLYELFGATSGSATSGTNGFLATYIIADKYIFAISVFENDDSTLGYDGQTLLDTLKRGRTLETEKGMTVDADADFVKGSGDGFLVKVNYDGEYTCNMSGYNITVDGKAVTADTVLTGENTLCVDVLNPVEPENEALTNESDSTNGDDETSAIETTGVAKKASASIKPLSASSDETTVEEVFDGALLAAPAGDATTQEQDAVLAAPAGDGEEESDATTLVTTEAPTDVAVNKLLGLLSIDNGADNTVYVEIYTIGGETFIARVRQ